jgi:hypothetical protein
MIQYSDNTFSEIGEAARISDALYQHFTGTERLPKEPIAAIFGSVKDLTQQRGERQALAALDERLAEVERQLRIAKRGIVRHPTDDDVERYGQVAP